MNFANKITDIRILPSNSMTYTVKLVFYTFTHLLQL